MPFTYECASIRALKSLSEHVCRRVSRVGVTAGRSEPGRLMRCPLGGHGSRSIKPAQCGRRLGSLYQESPVNGHQPLPAEDRAEEERRGSLAEEDVNNDGEDSSGGGEEEV